jgi:hypothetical protein
VDRNTKPTGGHLLAVVVEDPEGAEEEHDVEFYTLDVTSRGLVRLTDVASMLVKKWKETTKGAEEANKSLTAD